MPDSLTEPLAEKIASGGPITVCDYMAAANSHYYAARASVGATGDFITAPEISQMFGELVGLWLADLWARAGKPEPIHYVELGPGRGTLAHDALRAMASAGLTPSVEMVETSPRLRREQAARVPQARWHERIDDLPVDAPLLVVANEFFDALPVRQLIATGAGWCERVVDFRDGAFVPYPGPPVRPDEVPGALRASPAGTIVEAAPAAADTAQALAARLERQGGAAIVFDYGHGRTSTGETLQAVSRHAYADPWQAPGDADLTAHVDFEALGNAARDAGAAVFGPAEQGAWLRALGIDARAAVLAKSVPARADEIDHGRRRLVAPEHMGRLFKAMAFVAPGWPPPEGFE